MEETWRAYAACSELKPDIFYPTLEAEALEGIKVCHTCSVQDECLEYAVSHRIKEGTWGGQSQWIRNRIYRREQVRKQKEARALKAQEQTQTG